mmetsp:Transcript_43643/g.88030  ORF Transcript_43643/g.88030 Transcript_43643/m.88030 type:complete len:670 (+) Transcript_43643:406-2415(+)
MDAAVATVQERVGALARLGRLHHVGAAAEAKPAQTGRHVEARVLTHVGFLAVLSKEGFQSRHLLHNRGNLRPLHHCTARRRVDVGEALHCVEVSDDVRRKAHAHVAKLVHVVVAARNPDLAKHPVVRLIDYYVLGRRGEVQNRGQPGDVATASEVLLVLGRDAARAMRRAHPKTRLFRGAAIDLAQLLDFRCSTASVQCDENWGSLVELPDASQGSRHQVGLSEGGNPEGKVLVPQVLLLPQQRGGAAGLLVRRHGLCLHSAPLADGCLLQIRADPRRRHALHDLHGGKLHRLEELALRFVPRHRLLETLLQGHGRRRAEVLLHLVVVGHCHLHFQPGRLVVDRVAFLAQRVCDCTREIVDRVRLVGADVEDLVPCSGHQWASRDRRGDVVDVAEGAHLLAVAEDRQGLAMGDLVDENSNHVSVPVKHVLVRAVDVVRPEDDEVHTEELPGRMEIELERVFCDAVGVLWRRRVALGQPLGLVLRLGLVTRCRQRAVRVLHLREVVDAPVHGDGRREHEAGNAMLHRLVEDLHGSHEVGPVVEGADEVREALGRVGAEVVDVVDLVLREQPLEEHGVLHVALDEEGAGGDVGLEAAREVVQGDDLHPHVQAMPCHVAANEARSTGDQRPLAPGCGHLLCPSFAGAQRCSCLAWPHPQQQQQPSRPERATA